MSKADIQCAIDTIDRYVRGQCYPGTFMTAVLCNNLKEAFMWADENNRRYMFDIVNYCYNNIPSECWGSKTKFEAWFDPAQHTGLKKLLTKDKVENSLDSQPKT